MQIRKSKNINVGNLTAQGNITIGDSVYKSVEYKDIEQKIEDLEDLIAISKDEEKKQKYIQRLKNEKEILQNFIEEILSLAEKFSQIEINTERLKIAEEHFQKGEYREARAILGSKESFEELDLLIKQKDQLEYQVDKNQQALISKADELVILAIFTSVDYQDENRLNLTISFFEKSLCAYRSRENISEYASFLFKHHYYSKAKEYYSELVDIYDKFSEEQPTLDVSGYLVDLVFLVKLEILTGQFGTAENKLKGAIELGRKNISDLDEYSLFAFSLAINELAHLKIKKEQYANAAEHFKEALKIERILYKLNSDTHILGLTQILTNLADMHMKLNDVEHANKCLTEALDLYEKVFESKIETIYYLPQLLDVFRSLGELRAKEEKYELAYDALKEALKINRSLVLFSEQEYLPSLGGTLIELAKLLTSTKKNDEAEEIYSEAVLVYEKLSKDGEMSFEYNLSITYLLYGKLKLEKEDIVNADKLMGKALEIKRTLAKKDNEYYLPILAATLFELGQIKSTMTQYVPAEAFYKEALEQYQHLSERDYQLYEPTIAMVHNNLGALYFNMEDYESAEVFFSGANSCFSCLSDDDDFYLTSYAMVLHSQGNVQREKHDYQEAIKFYSWSSEIKRQLLDESKSVELIDNLGVTLYQLALALKLNQEIESACEVLYETQEIYKALSDHDDIYNENLNTVKELLGNLNDS